MSRKSEPNDRPEDPEIGITSESRSWLMTGESAIALDLQYLKLAFQLRGVERSLSGRHGLLLETNWAFANSRTGPFRLAPYMLAV